MTTPEPQTRAGRFHRIASYFMLKTIESLRSVLTFTNLLAQHAAPVDLHVPFSLAQIIFLAQDVLVKIAIFLLVVGQVLDLTFTHICELWHSDGLSPQPDLPDTANVTHTPLAADTQNAGSSQSSPSSQSSAAPIDPYPIFHDSRAMPELATPGRTSSLPTYQQAEIPALLQYVATFLLRRYLRELRVVDLGVSIDVLEVAKELLPPHHPDRPNTLSTLAIAIFIRSRQRHKELDLSEAIAMHQEALDVQHPVEAVHSSSLTILGDAAVAWCRHRGGDLHFLGGIDLRHRAPTIQLPRDPNQHQDEHVWGYTSSPSNERYQLTPQEFVSLHDSAVSWLEHYQREGGLGFLAESIQLFRKLLSILPPADVNRPGILSNLACAIHARYERNGDDGDLSDAIDLHREALSLFPHGHPSRPSSLNNLANALFLRYEQDGSARDLSDAIDLHLEALPLFPPGHPNRPASLTNLAGTILTRYWRDGEERDLSDTIDLHKEALSLQPPDSLDRPCSLANLASAILTRYERDGKEHDLLDVINLHREALSLRPPGHPDRSSSLSKLAGVILVRYWRDGGERDLSDAIDLHREAVSLQTPGSPNRPDYLNNLGAAILARYRRDGGERHLSDAIDLHQEALSLLPPGSPDRPRCLASLADAILARYERDGREPDLSDAIDLRREALSLQPPGRPGRPGSLNDLANALLRRYERDGGERDLSDAIDLYREALSLQPPSSPNRPIFLGNLAAAIRGRYERDGGERDLSDVIALRREAFSLFPPDHPNRAASLASLAAAILRRYERDGREPDLSEAIDLHREAFYLQPPGSLDLPGSLNDFANALLRQYERDGGERDLSEAIDLCREALTLLPPGSPSRPGSLKRLAGAILTRYRRDGEEHDLSEVIKLHQEALSLQPPGHPDRSSSLGSLAIVMFLRSEYLEEPVGGPFTRSERDGSGQHTFPIEQIIQLLRDAATARTSPIPDRLTIALFWKFLASEADPTSALEAYQCAFTLLGSALALGRSMQERHTNLLSRDTPAESTKRLALDAALWALFGPSRDSKLAVEVLDQGRNVLLASVAQFRADLSDIRRNDPTLADEFNRISRLLESVIIAGQEISERKSPHEDRTNRYKRISAEWEAIVAKIRLLPGCESFLLPAPYAKLQEAAADGPVIVIVVGKEESTAIIVMSRGEPHTIDLPQASEEALKKLYGEMDDALAALPNPGPAKETMRFVLSDLWDILVQPIIQELRDVLSIPTGSRIWWYPTSWASFLPLHAAGSYKKGESNVPHHYISSYTPTLQALKRARGRLNLSSDRNTSPLIIAQGQTVGQAELAHINEEVEITCRLVPSACVLSDDQATKERVMKELSNHSWIHLACHGHPNLSDPFQSHFALHDGPLSLQDIMTNELPSADFAYLSACHSAAQDRKLPDEGLTLAGGMQFAGFKSVMGTMWKMADQDAPMLAEEFYKGLAARSGDGKPFDCTKTAEALHQAVAELRKAKVPLYRWVNLVHYGI